MGLKDCWGNFVVFRHCAMHPEYHGLRLRGKIGSAHWALHALNAHMRSVNYAGHRCRIISRRDANRVPARENTTSLLAIFLLRLAPLRPIGPRNGARSHSGDNLHRRDLPLIEFKVKLSRSRVKMPTRVTQSYVLLLPCYSVFNAAQVAGYTPRADAILAILHVVSNSSGSPS